MDESKRQKLAAGIVIGVAVMACIFVLAILAGSFVYLKAKPQAPIITPVTVTPVAIVTPIDSPTSAPIQSYNPFRIESMKNDKAGRTYTFSLSLEPGAHPAEMSKILVNATHAGKDYGTVWGAGSGQMAWTKQTYDNGALKYGDVLTITIDMAAHGIPNDNKRTQLTFLYDGQAAFTQDMDPV